MNNSSLSPRGAHLAFPAPPPALLHHSSPPANAPYFALPPSALRPPLSPPKPPSDYLLHLVPQPPPSRLISFHAPPPPVPTNSPPQFTFSPQQRQFLERPPSQLQENKEFRPSTEQFENRNAMSSPQAFQQVTRSKGFSEFSPRFNSQIEGREAASSDYQHPRSPKEVANIEQVRRVSKYKQDSQASDKKSHRSSSHHNIHITIESTEGEPAPVITISPNKGKPAEQNLPHRIVSYPPQTFTTLQRPASISQTFINQQAPVHLSPQPVIVNQPPTFISHHPIFVQPAPPPPAALQAEASKQQQENTVASYSQLPNHQLVNDTLMRERISSLSIGEGRQRGKKHSAENLPRQEYYNQLAEREEEEEASNGCENRTTGFSAYLSEEKLMMNTRRLIDEIFENETNRALLQMRVLEARSRERVEVRKSGSRHLKKTML